MKKKIALLMTVVMLFGMNTVAFAKEPADLKIGERLEISEDVQTGESIEILEEIMDVQTGEPVEILGEIMDAQPDEQIGNSLDIQTNEWTESLSGVPTNMEIQEGIDVEEIEKPDVDKISEMAVQTEEVTQSENRTVTGSEIGAELFRWIEPEISVQAARGELKHINVESYRKFNEDIYEYYNDADHPFTSKLYWTIDPAKSFEIVGNTSSETKIIPDDFVTSLGLLDGFDVQIGNDETAEELTIVVKLGAWGYNLRNKESGEIIRITGNDDGRTISATIKVVDVADEFSFTRELVTEKACVSPGGESKVYMKYSPKFNTDKYTYYNDTEHYWNLGIQSCTVYGNASEKTVIEDRRNYANTRYLVVGEDETAEELTIIMECGGWTYWVKDKETGELFYIHNNEKETLHAVIKIGAEEDSSNKMKDEDNEIYIAEEAESDEDSIENNSWQMTYANTVINANGTKAVSAIDGIYQVTNVAGVAVVTPKEQVETVVGAESGESKVRFYVCNNRDKGVRSALEEAAGLRGKQMLTTFNMDLYVISKSGKVDKIYDTTSKIRVVIGIPEKYRNTDRPYTIGTIGTDGIFYIIEDLDDDPNTITIETDKFGIMTLMKG